MRTFVKQIAERGARTFAEKLSIPFLALASWGYGEAVKIRNHAFDAHWLGASRLPVPVISVGNLTWGGTGKTPFVKFLARKLELLSKKVLILTRGYSQDEVRELEEGVPGALIGIGKNRFRAARTAGLTDIAILDDGFQHRQLARDLDIVLVNCVRPFGSGHLIPWGNLREPLGELKRADLIVLTHADRVSSDEREKLASRLKQFSPAAGLLEACHVPESLFRAGGENSIDRDSINGKALISVSGIGFPESFHSTLEYLGGKIKRSFEFPDHHNFTVRDLEPIQKLKEKGLAQEIVVTEKDYFRAPEIMTRVLKPLVLGISFKLISGENRLDDRLHCLLAH